MISRLEACVVLESFSDLPPASLRPGLRAYIYSTSAIKCDHTSSPASARMLGLCSEAFGCAQPFSVYNLPQESRLGPGTPRGFLNRAGYMLLHGSAQYRANIIGFISE